MSPSTRLSPPELVDLVPAARVREIIVATDQEIALLEREADQACRAADLAELQAVETGVDGRSSTWAMVRMQRFLDGLRAESARDTESLLDLAHERARLRVGDARVEAERIRAGVSTTPPSTRSDALSWALIPTPEPVAVRDHVVPVPTPVPPVVEQHVVESHAEPAPPVMPVASAPDLTVVPDAPAPPPAGGDAAPAARHATNGEVSHLAMVAPVAAATTVIDLTADPSAPEPQPASVDDLIKAPVVGNGVAAVQDLPPVAEAQHVEDDSVSPFAPSATPVPSAPAAPPVVDASAAPPSEFWPEQPAKPKRGLRRIPVSAMLEVAAVLLILVFILLRLS